MDKQQSLFDDPQTVPYPPHNSRETSKAAADAIAPTAGTLRAMVLAHIRQRGDDGATDSEIQEALGMEGNTERPRRRELEQQGLIKDSGRKRRTPSGREAVVWVVRERIEQ